MASEVVASVAQAEEAGFHPAKYKPASRGPRAQEPEHTQQYVRIPSTARPIPPRKVKTYFAEAPEKLRIRHAQ
jgi:hypothetical protein